MRKSGPVAIGDEGSKLERFRLLSILERSVWYDRIEVGLQNWP